MSAKLNLAVLGLGRMGLIYLQTVAQSGQARLYAAADPNLARNPDLVADYDVTHALPDAYAVLERPEVDGVIIASPTSTHSDLVIAAAEAGKAIFCEKPLALTLEESRTALEAVERAGVPMQIGFMRRFDNAYRKAKALIEEGEIGRPTTFKSIGRDPFCPDPHYADPAKSGGLIIDMAIHDFDLARWLMGSEVTRAGAEGTLLACPTLREVGDIDNAVVNLRFENGAVGNVEVSRNAFYGYDIRTEVLGDDGAVNIGGYRQTPVLHLTREGARHDVVPYLMERFGEAYRAQIRHFVSCLQAETMPAVTGTDALAAFEIALAATHAARQGQPVTLEQVRAGRLPEG